MLIKELVCNCSIFDYQKYVYMKSYFLLSLSLIGLVGMAQERIWTLKECISYAMENNLSIERSKLNLENVEYDYTKSKFAFLPNLNASGAESLTFGRSLNYATNTLETNNRADLSLQLNSSVTVFNGRRLINSFKLNKAQVKSSAYNLMELENNISLNIANAYLQILFQKELLETADQQFKLSETQLERMQVRVEHGLESISKLLEVESQYYTDQQGKQTAYFNLQNSRLNLFQLLDVQDYEAHNIEIPEIESPDALEDLTVGNIHQIAQSNLPQYKKINADREVAVLNTKISKSSMMPSITMGAGLNTRAFSVLNKVGNTPYLDQLEDNFSQNVNMSINIPIFNRFNNSLNVQKALVNEMQIDINQQELDNQVYKDIQSALFNAKSALEAYTTAEKAFNSSTESYKNANERYKLAVLSIYDFQQSKNALFSAKSRLIQAKYDYIFKTMVLKFYQGHPITLE